MSGSDFSIKNKELSPEEIQERLDYYDIPTDLPLVAQISRFDPWKDPKGVIEAFKIASAHAALLPLYWPTSNATQTETSGM